MTEKHTPFPQPSPSPEDTSITGTPDATTAQPLVDQQLIFIQALIDIAKQRKQESIAAGTPPEEAFAYVTAEELKQMQSFLKLGQALQELQNKGIQARETPLPSQHSATPSQIFHAILNATDSQSTIEAVANTPLAAEAQRPKDQQNFMGLDLYQMAQLAKKQAVPHFSEDDLARLKNENIARVPLRQKTLKLGKKDAKFITHLGQAVAQSNRPTDHIPYLAKSLQITRAAAKATITRLCGPDFYAIDPQIQKIKGHQNFWLAHVAMLSADIAPTNDLVKRLAEQLLFIRSIGVRVSNKTIDSSFWANTTVTQRASVVAPLRDAQKRAGFSSCVQMLLRRADYQLVPDGPDTRVGEIRQLLKEEQAVIIDFNNMPDLLGKIPQTKILKFYHLVRHAIADGTIDAVEILNKEVVISKDHLPTLKQLATNANLIRKPKPTPPPAAKATSPTPRLVELADGQLDSLLAKPPEPSDTQIPPVDPFDLSGIAADDTISLYLKEMARVPLLTHAEEIVLAKAIENGHKAQTMLDEGYYFDQNDIDKLKRIIKRGPKAREHMIKANTRLVVSVAKKYQGLGVPFSDLIQEGNLGLIKGIDKFDYRRGYRLSTYVTWWVRQAITRALADQGPTIRVPVGMSDNIRKLKQLARQFEQRRGRKPTPEELANDLGIDVEKIEWMFEVDKQEPISTARKVGPDEDAELGGFLENQQTPPPSDAAFHRLLKEKLEGIITTLTPREAQIIRMRFGLGGYGRSYTLEEVGQKFGLTRERIRQIEGQALRNLRDPDIADQLRDFLD